MSSVPETNPVLAISAMRPSMITLVSSSVVRLEAAQPPELVPSPREPIALMIFPMSVCRMMKIETPKYTNTTTPRKGKTSPKGSGSSESGKASKAATSNPETRPIRPEVRVSAESLPILARMERIGRVVR